NTVFCLQFKHYNTGELVHVIWALRGKRPVTLTAPPGATVRMYDSMDTSPGFEQRPGQITVIASPTPIYVRRLGPDPAITLAAPNRADAQRAAEAIRLGDLGDGTWSLSSERDEVYEDSHAEFIRRFPGKFTSQPAKEADAHGKALTIHLDKQEKERKTMPFYT